MLCPRESGAYAAVCCQKTDGRWYKSPENFLPKPPVTGFSHPDCYLNNLGDCDHSISGEHLISAGVLKVFGNMLRMTGFPWINNGESKNISITRLKSAMLCTRHNNAFSSLDTQMERFVRWLRTFCNSSASIEKNMVLFNGFDIERWFFKTFLGLISSASLQLVHGHVVRNIDNMHKCVDLLLGDVPDEFGRGLWIRTKSNGIKTDLSFAVSPIYKPKTNHLGGLHFNFLGFDFLYSTLPLNAEESVFRPSQIMFRSPSRLRTIEISWPPNVIHSGSSIMLNWRGRLN